MNIYIKSARAEPTESRLQYFNCPFKACDVIRILIGPAIGIENIKPATNPISDIVNNRSATAYLRFDYEANIQKTVNDMIDLNDLPVLSYQ